DRADEREDRAGHDAEERAVRDHDHARRHRQHDVGDQQPDADHRRERAGSLQRRHRIGEQRHAQRLGDAEAGQEETGQGERDPEIAAHYFIALLSNARSPSTRKITVVAISAISITAVFMCGIDGVSAARIPSDTYTSGLMSTAYFIAGTTCRPAHG